MNPVRNTKFIYTFTQYENMKIEEKYVKVGERGQVVIPKSFRETEGIKPNQFVKMVSEPNQIVIRKISPIKEPEDVIFNILTKAKFTEEDWKKTHEEREEK